MKNFIDELEKSGFFVTQENEKMEVFKKGKLIYTFETNENFSNQLDGTLKKLTDLFGIVKKNEGVY